MRPSSLMYKALFYFVISITCLLNDFKLEGALCCVMYYCILCALRDMAAILHMHHGSCTVVMTGLLFCSPFEGLCLHNSVRDELLTIDELLYSFFLIGSWPLRQTRLFRVTAFSSVINLYSKQVTRGIVSLMSVCSNQSEGRTMCRL